MSLHTAVVDPPRIRPLDALVVNKIAAGEVIERPASVVKELLENSLDAGATRVDVDIARGGAERIRVADNGRGIHPEDLLLAVTSHATSKIESAEDLFQVQTLGFRGEALASIAAVSRLSIRSRTPEADGGFQIEVDGGRAGTAGPCGCPPGTFVEVRQLFHNTPVRRRFLKTPSTEFGHISEQFTRVALAQPRLHALLRHNDRTLYELPPTDNLLDRLALFYGSELAEQLIPVESEFEGVRLSGYVAHPAHSKATRKGQYLFLNGRWIQDRSLQHALTEAYRGLLMVGRYPVVFLFLEVPPDDVDVNVHPTKAEVRFRDAGQLYRQLLSTLRSQFLGMDLNSTLSVPGQPAANPSAPHPDPAQQKQQQIEFVRWANDRLAAWSPDQPPQIDPATTAPPQPPSPSGEPLPSASPPDQEGETGRMQTGEPLQFIPDQPNESPPSATPPAQLPPGRVMQIHDCYLLVETADGLTVIDQHALHERVLYEQLRERVLAGSVESQRMLVPRTIELSAEETALLLEHQELLAEIGFDIEEFGGQTLLLTGYPAMLARANLVQLVRDIAAGLAEAGQAPSRRDLIDSLLHMMACKAAIKAGQRLKPEEMESLLAQRHLIDDAHHCPHGRPTALVLTRAELDRQFGRRG